MAYNETERALMDALRGLSTKLRVLPAAHGNWTDAVKLCLVNLGRSRGCNACAHGCDRGEFLFDVVWLKKKSDDIGDVPLVVECEWGTDSHVVEDFEKLLLARSDHRMMIFDGTKVRDVNGLIERLHRVIHMFDKTQTADRYLFAFWKDDGFQFEHFVVA